jgi:uncharacterized protein YmfQ (DUF2313 family)
MASMSVDDYLSQFKALLLRGKAWACPAGGTLESLLRAFSEEFARVDARVTDLRNEADPRTAFEMLADWEAFAGLPDSCSAAGGGTIEERRAALKAKLLSTGGASEPYFRSVCEALGYEVEIDRFRPFVCGISQCGDSLDGAPSVRHTWRVRVPGARVTYFRAGQSQVGDRLGSFSRASDLECTLNKLKQAHTKLIVAYEGV